ncbi:MAG TPA: arylamine N-acetyltransferase [Micromonosporaceae bacterium]
MNDLWDVGRLDLDAYLARIGGIGARAPSRAALDELHTAHVRTFTFDNIDVLLDQHAGVDLDAVQAKFVGRGRGGYCFEHSTLFAAVLERLGYPVQRRLGRVAGPSSTGARTHCVVVATVDDAALLADPGFGMSLLRPTPLVDGATDDQDGWAFRVAAVPHGAGRAWELHRWHDGAWELMHAHDELPVQPVDLVCGHHYTSTYPASQFRHALMVTRHGKGRHTTLTHGTVTVRRPGQPTEHREISIDELRDLLQEMEVALTDAEQARLIEKVTALRALHR